MKAVFEGSTQAGAQELATRIRRFWAGKGLKPKVWVEVVFSPPSGIKPIYGVRSDMVGGRPRQSAEVAKEAA